MPHLERPGMIELLGRLGAESDATVLEAARELHRKIGEAGLTWDEVLRPETAAAFSGALVEDQTLAEEAVDDPSSTAGPDSAPPDQTEALRLIDRLLTRKTISSTLREDLIEMKRKMAEGDFDTMDARYVRALAKRLGA